jgi:DNA-binding transcriptional ArsR family regulator
MSTTITTQPLQIQSVMLRKAIYAIRAVNHELRMQMLQHMHQNGRISVSELYERLNLQQSVASQHLAILRREGFVLTKRAGKNIYYSVNYERLMEAESLCRQLTRKKTSTADTLLEYNLI